MVRRNDNSFTAVLTDALNDMQVHGFDTQARVDFWTERLRKAAEAAAKSSAQMERMLREALVSVYRRLVERGGVLKLSPGIARFTLERVRPALRAELDRRILASASLIRLNRDEAIEKTLRRFQGWATSIPVGGSADPEKQKAKETIKKSVAGLPFVERRVLTDQGHKLGNSINTTWATGNGAIAAVWVSNYRETGYDFRPAHKARDSHIYLVRDSWAKEKGLVKPGSDGYTDQITQPAEEVYCRCRWRYLFHLRQLPDDMLTNKGREAVEAVKAK